MSVVEDTFNDPRHRRSEELAFVADRLRRQGEHALAQARYGEAGRLELEVARGVGNDGTQRKLRSIFAISAVVYLHRGGLLSEAVRAAHEFLARPEYLQEEGVAELESSLDDALRSRELHGLLGPDVQAVPLEIRLEGGDVRRGLAPTKVIQAREGIVESVLLRVADWRAGYRFRPSGRSAFATALSFYEAPARAASYGIRFFVCSAFNELEEPRVTSVEAVDSFLELAELAVVDPNALKEYVGDQAYSQAFLRAFRDLAPDGTLVGRVSISSPGTANDGLTARFLPEHRIALSTSLAAVTRSHDSVRGVLKSIRLHKGRAISVEDDKGATHVFVLPTSEHDDTIGLKLNRRVEVTATRVRRRNGTFHLVVDDVIVAEGEGDEDVG